MKKDDEKVFMGMDESESYLHQNTGAFASVMGD